MYLLHLGFICSKVDPSLFILKTHKGKIFLLLYVDDIIVTGSNPSHVLELVLQRGKEFAMKDLGNLHFFLGVEVTNFDGGIHWSQSKYVVELLDKNEITFAKAISTHFAQKHGIHEVVGILVETSFYKMIVESLQYLTLTRPNIIHVVNLASQFMQNPKVHIFKGWKEISGTSKTLCTLDLDLFHNHHVGCMDTLMLIGEVVQLLEVQLQAIAST